MKQGGLGHLGGWLVKVLGLHVVWFQYLWKWIFEVVKMKSFPFSITWLDIRKGLLEQSVFYDCPSPCKEVQYEEEKNEIASKEMSNRKWTFKHEGKEC